INAIIEDDPSSIDLDLDNDPVAQVREPARNTQSVETIHMRKYRFRVLKMIVDYLYEGINTELLQGSWPKCTPNHDTLTACLEYLKQQGDAEKTEEFGRLLGAPGHMSMHDIERSAGLYIYSQCMKKSRWRKEVDDIKSFDNEETDENANEAT
ncbi:hypothetical protein IFM89_025758, partial [Coptis chinensis]